MQLPHLLAATHAMGRRPIRAERSEVLPAPGGPETRTEVAACITAHRKPAAAAVNADRSTREPRWSPCAGHSGGSWQYLLHAATSPVRS